MVDRRPTNHGENRIAVGLCVTQPLEHEHRTPLAPHETVRVRREGFTAPVGSERTCTRHGNRDIRVEEQIRRRCEGERTLVAAQRLARLVQRHQRRGAGGIERECGPFESKRVRQATGGRVHRIAGEEESVERRGALGHQQRRVVVGRHAEKHPGGRSLQAAGRKPCRLERFPCGFEQQSLLRIEPLCLARRHPEERPVEILDRVEKAAVTGIRRAGMLRIGMIKRRHIPAARRHLRDDITALGEHPPEFVGGAHPARPAASLTDNRNRFETRGFERGNALLERGDREQRPLDGGSFPVGNGNRHKSAATRLGCLRPRGARLFRVRHQQEEPGE